MSPKLQSVKTNHIADRLVKHGGSHAVAMDNALFWHDHYTKHGWPETAAKYKAALDHLRDNADTYVSPGAA